MFLAPSLQPPTFQELSCKQPDIDLLKLEEDVERQASSSIAPGALGCLPGLAGSTRAYELISAAVRVATCLISAIFAIRLQKKEIQEHLKNTLPLGATRQHAQQHIEEVEDEGMHML